MEEEDKSYLEDYKEFIDQAKELKEHYKLESLDTAILLMINLEVDLIRFHNTD